MSLKNGLQNLLMEMQLKEFLCEINRLKVEEFGYAMHRSIFYLFDSSHVHFAKARNCSKVAGESGSQPCGAGLLYVKSLTGEVPIDY